MGLPTESNVEEWLKKLGESDQPYAAACATLTVKKESLKIAKARALGATGTAAEKERTALTSPEYQIAIEELRDAEYEKKLLELRRTQYILGIEVWRSLNANLRKS